MNSSKLSKCMKIEMYLRSLPKVNIFDPKSQYNILYEYFKTFTIYLIEQNNNYTQYLNDVRDENINNFIDTLIETIHNIRSSDSDIPTSLVNEIYSFLF